MKLKIIIFNLLVIFIIAEVFSRYIIQSEYYMESIYGNTTQMWQTMWQNKNSTRDDYYSVIYEHHDRYGWNLKPKLTNYKQQANSFYTTNSEGLRSNKEFEKQNKNNKYRIAIIGDSYTEGVDVNNGETWGDFLEKNRPDSIEVLNFGVGGFGHDQCLVKLQNEVLAYKPDLVILGFLNCDISRNIVAFRDYAKPIYSLKGDKLVLKNDKIEKPDFYRKNSFLKSIILFKLLINNEKQKSWKYQDKLAKKIIMKMNEVCQEKDIDFKLVFLPGHNELYDKSYEGVNLSKICDELYSEKNIHFTNLTEDFQKLKDTEKLINHEGHWDAFYNKMIADKIYSELKISK